MSNSPAISHKDAVKVAEYLGFIKRSHDGTSHVQFKNPTTGAKATIPAYKEPYGHDLFASICRQLGVTKKQFFGIFKQVK